MAIALHDLGYRVTGCDSTGLLETKESRFGFQFLREYATHVECAQVSHLRFPLPTGFG
ncbi:hypothetical protein [Rhizobium tumorigenes]|uniref:Uncharacterized protein n=1 Tax=Rhizobium tumorigenes TaxID=2041385 RepID=A0AAF1KM15_9HYPH|nr:hypothetical protein [Rhizobium tumorigenes]WFR97698.1 hypothetical protein PR017_21180 [Rhizobium tumorigenes]